MHEAQHSENSNEASRDGGGSRQLLGSFFAAFWLEIYDFDHIFWENELFVLGFSKSHHLLTSQATNF